MYCINTKLKNNFNKTKLFVNYFHALHPQTLQNPQPTKLPTLGMPPLNPCVTPNILSKL